MTKAGRLMKRLVALVVVLLLSINSFAAGVGDNDGAAFITKAEFESLKNDFQTQINRYNTSLDNKIDGAIAGYLSALNITKAVKTNIVFSNWDEYTMLSYALEPTFAVPKLHADYIWMHNANFSIPIYVNQHRGMENHMYHEQGAVHAVFDYRTFNDMKKMS